MAVAACVDGDIGNADSNGSPRRPAEPAGSQGHPRSHAANSSAPANG